MPANKLSREKEMYGKMDNGGAPEAQSGRAGIAVRPRNGTPPCTTVRVAAPHVSADFDSRDPSPLSKQEALETRSPPSADPNPVWVFIGMTRASVLGGNCQRFRRLKDWVMGARGVLTGEGMVDGGAEGVVKVVADLVRQWGVRSLRTEGSHPARGAI